MSSLVNSRPAMTKPRSCDTFVVLPPNADNDCVVFGKNSDRPSDEVQEVVYVDAADHSCPSKVKCTYIEIEQVPHTCSVILSKPSWMWGAEMGANEHGVCIGNEAVWTKLNGPEDSVEKLLGMDILRLGLERSTTAEEAVRIMAALLEAHGQGGNCSDSMEDFTYHNSFLCADPTEAWVLETAGHLWVAEKVVHGVRNISNELSIGTDIALTCSNLYQHAEENNMWNAREGELSFKKVYGYDENSYRYTSGRRLLTLLSSGGKFKEVDMFKVLRDTQSGICMSSGDFVSTSSQVSTLYKPRSGKPSCHWFTGTPDPKRSIFKPFIFVEAVEYPLEIVSPTARDYKHTLYQHHEKYFKSRSRHDDKLKKKRLECEEDLIRSIARITIDFDANKAAARTIFKNSVEREISFLTGIVQNV